MRQVMALLTTGEHGALQNQEPLTPPQSSRKLDQGPGDNRELGEAVPGGNPKASG